MLTPDPDDLTVLVDDLRAALDRLTRLHAAELDDLRARHAAVIDALTRTYRDEITRLTTHLAAQRKETP